MNGRTYDIECHASPGGDNTWDFHLNDNSGTKVSLPVAAKHIETMQRSNEQLVKVLALKHKERNKDIGLTDEDKASLFDLIQGEN